MFWMSIFLLLHIYLGALPAIRFKSSLGLRCAASRAAGYPLLSGARAPPEVCVVINEWLARPTFLLRESILLGIRNFDFYFSDA
jgi:hypothetical protein